MNRSARSAKVTGDLRASKARTVLVVLSIAVAVASVGTVAGARAMIVRSLDRSAAEARFASATFRVDGIPPRVAAAVRAVPGVTAAETRHVLGARVGDETLVLIALDDYADQPLARVSPVSGAWPPPPDGVLLERASAPSLGARGGDSILVELPSGSRHRLGVAGTVHDLNLPATTVSGIAYGYLTGDTLRRLGEGGPANQLDIGVAGDRRQVERVATSVRQLLDRSGVTVGQVTVPEPGTFWAKDAVRSMILLLTVLAAVSLLLSAFLVVNIVSALVAQQVRQIGVLKAVGAKRSQTAALYLVTALAYGVLATAIGIPVAALGSRALVTTASTLINLDVGFALPADVLALELAAGLLLPVAAALGPVWHGSGITVRDAIARHGLEGGPVGRLVSLLGRVRGLPAGTRLALTNTVRRRRRLLLTLGTLVLAGSVLVGVVSLRESMLGTLDTAATYRGVDVQVDLEEAQPGAAVEHAVAAVPGVAGVEGWALGGAYRRRPDGSESQTYPVVAVPVPGLLHPAMLRGRWLDPSDADGVVVNTDVLDGEDDLRPGMPIVLVLDGRPQQRRVVGVARRVVAGPVVYLTLPAGSTVQRLVVVGGDHDPAAQAALSGRVRARLTGAGVAVASVRTESALRALDRKNYGVIVTFLLAMAVLLGVVAGLGLLGTLSLNVLERSREIGVLRAVGAGDAAVVQLVLVEGLVVAVLGWLASLPLAVPIGSALTSAVGQLFLGAPLEFRYSWRGALVWLALALVIATVASLVPARRAARYTVRDVLAWE